MVLQSGFRHYTVYWVVFTVGLVIFGIYQGLSKSPKQAGAVPLAVSVFPLSKQPVPDASGPLHWRDIEEHLWRPFHRGLEIDYYSVGAWFRLELPSSRPTPALLVVRQAYIDQLDIHAATSAEETRVQLGDQRPFHTRPIAHPYLLYRIDDAATQWLYAFVHYPGSTHPNFELWEPQAFYLSDRATSAIRSILFGMLAFAIILNALLYWAYRRAQYLWYQGSLLAGTIVQLILSGASAQFLWPNYPALNNSLPPLIGLNLICAVFFTSRFLALEGFKMQLCRLIALTPLSIWVAFPINTAWAATLSITLTALIPTALFFIAVECYRKRHSNAAIYLVSSIPLLAGIGTSLLEATGRIPAFGVTGTGMLWGFALNSLILTHALSRNIQRTQQTQIETEKKLIVEQAARLEIEAEKRRLLQQNYITHLPNRECFAQWLSQHSQHPYRKNTTDLTVWVVRIQRFPYIECTLTPDQSAALLRHFSSRLAHEVQHVFGADLVTFDDIEVSEAWPNAAQVIASIDTPVFAFATVSRLESHAENARALLSALGEPYAFGGIFWALQPFAGSASTPVVPFTAKQAHETISLATHALAECTFYARWQHYDLLPSQSFLESRQFSWDIEGALARKELFLVFQPKVWLRSKKIAGFECLLRWRHPEGEFISPELIVQHAERAGVITTLSLFVFSEALNFLNVLHRESGHPYSVSINVSPFDLLSPHFVDSLTQSMLGQHIHPGQLMLEITEASAIEGIQTIAEHMTRLNRLGITFALDDFGTGYSSLAVLNQLPLNELKIDRSLLPGVQELDANKSTLRSAIRLGTSLRLNTVIEGIEDLILMDWLAKEADLIGQGFGIGKPMVAEDVCPWIHHWQQQNGG